MMRWTSPKRIPEKAMSRKVPSTNTSETVEALCNIRRSHCNRTRSGRGKDSRLSATTWVLLKLETIGEKQSLKHVNANCRHAHRMAFSVMELNFPASEAPVISRSARPISSSVCKLMRKLRQMVNNVNKQLMYRRTVLGENPSRMRMMC